MTRVATPPFLGRQRELLVLRARLDEARAGRGSLVRVTGDAGIGKTALAPNRRIAWRSWAPYPGVVHAGEWSFDLAAEDGQSTRLTQTARLYDNWLGALVSTLVFKTTPAKAHVQWAASPRNIQAILEAEAPTGQPAADHGATRSVTGAGAGG